MGCGEELCIGLPKELFGFYFLLALAGQTSMILPFLNCCCHAAQPFGQVPISLAPLVCHKASVETEASVDLCTEFCRDSIKKTLGEECHTEHQKQGR